MTTSNWPWPSDRSRLEAEDISALGMDVREDAAEAAATAVLVELLAR